MFKGKRHYNEFLEGGEHVSTSVLGSRLRQLLEAGMISKGEDEVKKSRIKYSLTQKGIDMLPFMVELILWSGTYDVNTEAGQDFLNQAKDNRDGLIKQIRENLIIDHLSTQ